MSRVSAKERRRMTASGGTWPSGEDGLDRRGGPPPLRAVEEAGERRDSRLLEVRGRRVSDEDGQRGSGRWTCSTTHHSTARVKSKEAAAAGGGEGTQVEGGREGRWLAGSVYVCGRTRWSCGPSR